jgi:hypothetical protein
VRRCAPEDERGGGGASSDVSVFVMARGGVAWHQEKQREAERFLWWHSNGLTILTAVIVALGVVVGLLNYLK